MSQQASRGTPRPAAGRRGPPVPFFFFWHALFWHASPKPEAGESALAAEGTVVLVKSAANVPVAYGVVAPDSTDGPGLCSVFVRGPGCLSLLQILLV